MSACVRWVRNGYGEGHFRNDGGGILMSSVYNDHIRRSVFSGISEVIKCMVSITGTDDTRLHLSRPNSSPV